MHHVETMYALAVGLPQQIRAVDDSLFASPLSTQSESAIQVSEVCACYVVGHSLAERIMSQDLQDEWAVPLLSKR
jgi:hypothetical protein